MIRNILFLFSLLLFSAIASASVNNTPPLKIDRVIDRANLLTAQQFKTLNNLLINFENNRNDGSQFVVYIVPTTGSENIETFANRVFNQWGIGKKGLDNGLLLVVAINDRSVRFEVGYGYEGTFTDVLAGRIIRKNMLPYFRAENYYTGIEQGIINAIHVANDRPISSTNSLTDLIPLKILQTHFILIYVIILGLIYCFQLVFSTKKLKRKINQVIAQSGKKKNSEKRGYKIGANQLKRLKNYLNYSFYFPTSFSLYFPVVFCSVVVIFYTQIILNGIVNPFILLLMVVLSLFFNLISLTVLFIGINILFPIYRQQRKEWKAICEFSRFGSPFYQPSYSVNTSHKHASNFTSSHDFSSSSSSSSSSGGGGGSSGGGGASGHW